MAARHLDVKTRLQGEDGCAGGDGDVAPLHGPSFSDPWSEDNAQSAICSAARSAARREETNRARGNGRQGRLRAPCVARAHALPTRGSARRTIGYAVRPPAAPGHPLLCGMAPLMPWRHRGAPRALALRPSPRRGAILMRGCRPLPPAAGEATGAGAGGKDAHGLCGPPSQARALRAARTRELPARSARDALKLMRATSGPCLLFKANRLPFRAIRRRSFAQGPWRARSAIGAVANLAPVTDALRSRLRAVREDVPQLRQLRIAVLFHELRDVVAAAPAARLALDREGGDAEIRESVGVVSHCARRAAPAGPRGIAAGQSSSVSLIDPLSAPLHPTHLFSLLRPYMTHETIL